MTISPVGLAERPEPYAANRPLAPAPTPSPHHYPATIFCTSCRYTTDLVLGVHSQQSGRVTITAKVGVSATPVADRSVWGRMPLADAGGAMQTRGCGDVEMIADVLTLAVGDSEDIPFQTCDVEGLQARHTSPPQSSVPLSKPPPHMLTKYPLHLPRAGAALSPHPRGPSLLHCRDS